MGYSVEELEEMLLAESEENTRLQREIARKDRLIRIALESEGTDHLSHDVALGLHEALLKEDNNSVE